MRQTFEYQGLTLLEESMVFDKFGKRDRPV
jgi:hypothetical protein